MTEYGPFMVHQMLQYCYLLSYDANPLSIDGTNEPYKPNIYTHVQMYKMGRHFDLQGMKLEAYNKFKDSLNLPKAELAQQDVSEFLEVLPCIYSSTLGSGHEMRTIAASFGYVHWGKLVARPDFEDIAAQNIKWIIEIITKTRIQDSRTGQSPEHQGQGTQVTQLAHPNFASHLQQIVMLPSGNILEYGN